MFNLTPTELIVCGIVAIMLFGSKLPEVAQDLGKKYGKFKRTLDDVQSQFRNAEYDLRRSLDQPAITSSVKPKAIDEEDVPPTVPKFTPPTA